MEMSKREQSVCESIETLLFAATERKPTGSLDDVLLRIIENSEFATMARYPSDGLGIEDARKLAAALWSVIASKDVNDLIGMKSTIPNVTHESTRFDFAEYWAKYLTYVCVPETDPRKVMSGIPATEDKVREIFEEYLVSVVAHYCVHLRGDDSFMLSFIVPKMDEFCRALGAPPRMGHLCERLLYTLSFVEANTLNREEYFEKL